MNDKPNTDNQIDEMIGAAEEFLKGSPHLTEAPAPERTLLEIWKELLSNIEAAADQIALLFTDHAHPMSTKDPDFLGYSQLEIAAHRNGPTGVVPLEFIGKYQQIGDWMGDIPKRLAEPEKPMVRRAPSNI